MIDDEKNCPTVADNKCDSACSEETLPVCIRPKMRSACQQCCTVQLLKRKLPFLQWLPEYRCHHFLSDLIAGLTVGLTVIPQGLAYAIIAGLPPQYGLYSAFMGCFVYMFLGTSKDVTLGPTAIMSLMVGTFAASSANGDVGLACVTAILLTFVSGVVQLVMGLLNLGILVSFISHPVINAFTSAAAITIAFGQVKNVLGLKNIPRDFVHMIYETFRNIPETKIWDLVMALVSMVALFFIKKLRTIEWGESSANQLVPLHKVFFRKLIWLVGTGANVLVVIVAASITAGLISYDIHVITITGNITSGLPGFTLPQFSYGNVSTGDMFSRIGAGFIVVPFLGLVESIAIGKAFARVNNYKIDPTQELLAIGVANIVSSFVHSYPITGSFSRTAVNSQCGVKTPAGGLFTGILLLMCLQFLVPYCYYIPQSALAAVIIMAVLLLVDYKIIPVLWRTNKWDLLIHAIVFVCSLAVGIEYGIVIGIGLQLLVLLYPMARPRVKVTDRRNCVIIQPDQGFLFPAVEYVERKVLSLVSADSKPKCVVFDMTHISSMDITSLHGLRSIVSDMEQIHVSFVICCLNHRVLRDITKENIENLTICKSMAEAFDELTIHVHEAEEDQPFVLTT